MIVKFVFYLFFAHFVVSQVIYDAYFGKPIKDDRGKQLDSLNLTGPCTVKVEPCKKHEGRRIDGTCVNPKYPSRGASPTPLLRMRPAKFGLGNNLRPAMNGSELPSARLLRVKILSDGYPEDHQFNTLATHVFVFSTVDVADLTVLLRYAIASDCCLGNTPNRVNPLCIPIPVPQDDPYLRRTGIRCMNLTRFSTYQEMGCIPNTLPAERYNLPTPLQDLSIVYGYSDVRERQIRTYQGGLLKSDERDEVERPPGTSPICINNRRPVENACYEFGDFYDGNVLAGIYLTAMWFYREHNRLARKLAGLNPCWDDQKLFETARQINIAQWQYILYYELMADILGPKNALETGVIYDTNGYVNDFDERYKPGVYHEYLVGTRWFHTFQDGRTDLYSGKGKYLGTRTTVDDELRSGILEVNNTEADLTQGAFRQRAAKFDYTIEPDIAERVLGELQSASDLSAIDIMRGRDQGLPPYNEYRKICGLPVAHKFKDFEDTIYPDKVEQLRRIYDDEVDDMELMVAIYSERLLHGAWVGPTLFCIMVENLVNWRKSDRFFFENGYSHAALTLPQLNEVRRTSMARLLCDNGDGVVEIQPKAMLNVGKQNRIIPCKQIPGIDLYKWVDPKCYPAKKDQYEYSVPKDQYQYPENKDQNEYSVPKDEYQYPPGKYQDEYSVLKDRYQYPAEKDQYEYSVPKDQYQYPPGKDQYDYLVLKDRYQYRAGQDQYEYSVPKDQNQYPEKMDQNEYSVPKDQYQNPAVKDQKEYSVPKDQNQYPEKKDQNEHPVPKDQNQYPEKKDQNEYSVPKDQNQYPAGKGQNEYPVPKAQYQYPAGKDQYEGLRTNNYNPLWRGSGYDYKKK